MDQKEQEFYDNEVFAQAQVVQHPKEKNHTALVLDQSFHLLSGSDLAADDSVNE
ncbi:transcriptional regulator SplA domain-containing protein [Metabacillus endolithicus]|uniref:Transcriptional regulator SplA domain-containing protein n=1 Tax=Metabacillus endolithicus TaxID=1535204 RepID=A0ABW5C1Q3_9BACI|nr:transcriptional regulator SplA domain-containing protein [Metabacillus endolithicus]UPG62252.1 hypothetical protein MVE64_17200 [Metabacillus endolithicus]